MPSFHAGDAVPASTSEPGDIDSAEQRALRCRRIEKQRQRRKNKRCYYSLLFLLTYDPRICTVFTKAAFAIVVLIFDFLPTIEPTSHIADAEPKHERSARPYAFLSNARPYRIHTICAYMVAFTSWRR